MEKQFCLLMIYIYYGPVDVYSVPLTKSGVTNVANSL